MKPSFITRRAQALINLKCDGGETVCPLWLVSALERMAGVTAHRADQAAAKALASPETAIAAKLAEQVKHCRKHPASLAAARCAAALRAELSAAVEKREKGEAGRS